MRYREREREGYSHRFLTLDIQRLFPLHQRLDTQRQARMFPPVSVHFQSMLLLLPLRELVEREEWKLEDAT